ncbi:hypothetical protein QR680_003670 [Steinernema hermaphroditum]|uniref:Uncharacterized protein n=1 Tax=Steinernema hermaphroditum TaxID=289476 RepID=A0AA39HL59_9BILA|nr:hypothetical protein QR680_003670 [Steinernema hermaphroditum]
MDDIESANCCQETLLCDEPVSTEIRARHPTFPFPVAVLDYVVLFSSQKDRKRIASLSQLTQACYRDFRCSINHFDLADMAEELQPYGGLAFAPRSWCEFVVNFLIETPIGNLRSVDLSVMKEKVIEKLYNCTERMCEQTHPLQPIIPNVFASVTSWVLPQYVDWRDMNALCALAPNLEELIITYRCIDMLNRTSDVLLNVGSISEVIETIGGDPKDFTNLLMFEKETKRLRVDASEFTHFVAFLRHGLKNLKLVIVLCDSNEKREDAVQQHVRH